MSVKVIWNLFVYVYSLDFLDSDSHENNQNFSNTINASSALSRLNNRAHTFVQKSIVIPEMCYPCGKK